MLLMDVMFRVQRRREPTTRPHRRRGPRDRHRDATCPPVERMPVAVSARPLSE
jgi:hypothetical protein